MEIAEAKRSIDEMLHTACCYGMGIGTPANLTQTLIYCVCAAKQGYLPAQLTAISLFQAGQYNGSEGNFKALT